MADRNIRAMYGTLKAGHYNYLRFHMDSPEVCSLLWKGRVEGFEMWASGIPFVKRGAGSIVIEVYEFKDLVVLNAIDAMETGAGYRLEPVEVPELPILQVSLYLYPGSTKGLQKVHDGDFQP